jgi:hypothetical protein
MNSNESSRGKDKDGDFVRHISVDKDLQTMLTGHWFCLLKTIANYECVHFGYVFRVEFNERFDSLSFFYLGLPSSDININWYCSVFCVSLKYLACLQPISGKSRVRSKI